MCQEENRRKMEGSGVNPHQPSWSQTVYTLKDITTRYDDTNLPKYLFVHTDYSDESMGLHLKSGDLLEVFGFHSLSCVKAEYDAGQQGMLSVSIPLTYEGKVRRLPKCEYQFPLALDMVRHFPKFVRVTYAPRSKEGPLGLGEVLELVNADRNQEVLNVKRNGENLKIPFSCRGDFEEILFKDSKDYDLQSLVNNHLCPMWAQLTEMKRIREGFTSFKHFSGEVKLNFVMEEKLLLCRVVKDDDAVQDHNATVEVMCVPVESVCRNGTSPLFKIPTGILKDSQRMFSALPDWDLGQLHTSVEVLNYITTHKAHLHPRKFNPIITAEEDTNANEITSPSISDLSADTPVNIPVPPPRRKKQLKFSLSLIDSCPDAEESNNRSHAKSCTLYALSECNADKTGEESADEDMIAYWKTQLEHAPSNEDIRDKNQMGSNGNASPYALPKKPSPRGSKNSPGMSTQSSIPDVPPPTPPRIDLDSRLPPPPPVPCRPNTKSPKNSNTPSLPSHSSKQAYLTTRPRAALPPEPPHSVRPPKPSINDHVPPPLPKCGYLSMTGIAGDMDHSVGNYYNDDTGHPRPPSPGSDYGHHKKEFAGPIGELDRKAWERDVPALPDETEDFYTIAEDHDDPSEEVEEENYLCMSSYAGRPLPQMPAQATQPHFRPPALPPRVDRYSASSTSSNTTWSSGYNSDTPEGTVNSVSDIASIPHNVSCLSVSALAESLNLLKLEKLADACRDNFIDGVMFAALTAEDLKGDPFNLSGFHLKKALMFKDEGWTPKIN